MKRTIKILIALLAGIFILSGASGKTMTAQASSGAGTPPTTSSATVDKADPASSADAGETQSFLMGYEKNLQPGPAGGAKELWIKPGVDFSKYNKVMLDSVTFFFDPNAKYKGIDPVAMKELADKFNKALVDSLSPSYPIVTEPGPDVVRIRTAITGIEQSKPALSGVTSVMPVGLGVSLVKRGATGAWTGSGATGADMMMLDSQTNDVLSVARDKRTAGFTERFSKWGSAEEAFKFWADRVKLALDEAHGVKTG